MEQLKQECRLAKEPPFLLKKKKTIRKIDQMFSNFVIIACKEKIEE